MAGQGKVMGSAAVHASACAGASVAAAAGAWMVLAPTCLPPSCVCSAGRTTRATAPTSPPSPSSWGELLASERVGVLVAARARAEAAACCPGMLPSLLAHVLLPPCPLHPLQGDQAGHLRHSRAADPDDVPSLQRAPAPSCGGVRPALPHQTSRRQPHLHVFQ